MFRFVSAQFGDLKNIDRVTVFFYFVIFSLTLLDVSVLSNITEELLLESMTCVCDCDVCSFVYT